MPGKSILDLLKPITPVAGDTTKKTIQLKSGLAQDVLVGHQDISGKQDNLAFEGTYNASTNKVATVSAVTGYLAPEYTEKTYAAGELCIKDAKLYQSKNAISTAESWNSSHWTEIKISDILNGDCSIGYVDKRHAGINRRYPDTKQPAGVYASDYGYRRTVHSRRKRAHRIQGHATCRTGIA